MAASLRARIAHDDANNPDDGEHDAHGEAPSPSFEIEVGIIYGAA